MNDHRVGTSLRAIRHRKKLRQVDVAARAGTSATMVARVERGSLANIPVGSVRRVAEALDARLDLVVRWHGGDFDRLINARHAGMHEAMAREFRAFPGWMAKPEVSFSVYGERGVIDILAWHPATRQLLVIELKTELVDINELLATLDRKRRLARGVALDRGWDPLAISSWVVIAEGRTNRRAVANHAAALRAKLPADGRSMRAWLRKPAGRVDAPEFPAIPPWGDASARSRAREARDSAVADVAARRSLLSDAREPSARSRITALTPGMSRPRVKG